MTDDDIKKAAHQSTQIFNKQPNEFIKKSFMRTTRFSIPLVLLDQTEVKMKKKKRVKKINPNLQHIAHAIQHVTYNE